MGELPATLRGLLSLPNQPFSTLSPAQWDYQILIPCEVISWSYLQMSGSCHVS